MPAPRLRAPSLSDETSGVLLALLAMAFFASMDALSKGLSERYDPVMVTWARYLSQAVLVLLILSPRIRIVGRTRHPLLQALRSALIFGATLSFFIAIAHIPLAEATAIFEVAPLMVTMLAALILKESVGARRWAGVVAGFAGALIIVRPGLAVFQPMALLPMLAALFYALHAIVTRFLGRDENPLTTLLYSGLIGVVCASILAPFHWTTPTWEDAALMTLCGAVGGVGHLLLITAFARASAATLAPTGYFGLVIATIYSVAIFGEAPDLWTVTGAVVIVGSGLYVWRRELDRGAVKPGGPSP